MAGRTIEMTPQRSAVLFSRILPDVLGVERADEDSTMGLLERRKAIEEEIAKTQ
jgi:hypothetical protein